MKKFSVENLGDSMKKVLSLEHRKKLAEASRRWWELNRNTECVVQRNKNISLALHGKKFSIERIKSIRTGTVNKCEQCGKDFYVYPKQHLARFCCRACMIAFLREKGSWRRGTHTSTNVTRKLLISLIGHCEICGFSDKRILTIHHNDLNTRHNTRENVKLLCPNCHTLVHLEKRGYLKIKGCPSKKTNMPNIEVGKS